MEGITSWAQGIIIAVIIGTIIEMILPNSGNSKYIKVIIGLFILFSIINPVIGKVSTNFIETDSLINLEDYELELSSNSVTYETLEQQKNAQIMNVYKENIQLDIQSKVQIKGFKTENVVVQISNDNQYRIEKIEFTVTEKNTENTKQKQAVTIVDNIENIKINLSNNQKNAPKGIIAENEKKMLKDYLNNVYEVPKENINIL